MQITCSHANRISPVRCSVLFMRPLAVVQKLADERCGTNPPERPMFHRGPRGAAYRSVLGLPKGLT